MTANVSNTVGLTFGSMSGAVGYRRELRGQRHRVLVLGSTSFVGGLTGGILLLTLPSSVFDAVIPVLILTACALVIVQPRLSVWVAARRSAHVEHGGDRLVRRDLRHRYLRRLLRRRAGRNPSRAAGNFHRGRPAATERREERARASSQTVWPRCCSCFPPTWSGRSRRSSRSESIVGGQVGAHVGRRLPERLLRVSIVVIGVIAAVKLIAT